MKFETYTSANAIFLLPTVSLTIFNEYDEEKHISVYNELSISLEWFNRIFSLRMNHPLKGQPLRVLRLWDINPLGLWLPKR